ENGRTVTEDVRVGTFAANRLNPQDNVVHPTPAATQYGSGNEVDVEAPAQYKSWRGGCGNVTAQQSKLSRGAWGARKYAFQGSTFGSTTGRTTAIGETGLSHTYGRGTDLSKLRICAITYDVHKGQAPKDNGGVGIPGSAKEITAGGSSHNGDNAAGDNPA